MEQSDLYSFRPVGIIHSPFKEKFGIPRQPGLVPGMEAVIELFSPFDRPEAVLGLDSYSHIWVQFIFHRALREGWRSMVRPPRLGGNVRVGVFASRSPFRPNPIGLSVVELVSVDVVDGCVSLRISGGDFLDGTPVLDIKPYVEYADSIQGTRGGFSVTPPKPKFEVRFSVHAERQLQEREGGTLLRAQIEGLLGVDPRPAYREGETSERVYGMHLYDFDLRWCVREWGIEVLELAVVK